MLYIRSNLKATEYKPSTAFPEKVWCQLIFYNCWKFFVGVCYRTPSERIFGPSNHVQIRELLAESSRANFMLMGDFNYPGVDWCGGEGLRSSATGEEALFWDCVEDNFLTQHVNIPTRKTATLDLVFTRDKDIIDDVQSIGKFGNTDHDMLKWEVRFRTEKKMPSLFNMRDYSKANYVGIRHRLAEINWRSLVESEPMDKAWTAFKDVLSSLEEEYIPLKRTASGTTRKPIWMNNKTLKAVRHKHTIFRKYRDSNHPACRLASRLASVAVQEAKRKFERKMASNIKIDNKTFFAYVRSKSKAKVSPGKPFIVLKRWQRVLTVIFHQCLRLKMSLLFQQWTQIEE